MSEPRATAPPNVRGILRTLARGVVLTLALAAIACGKRAFVPEETGAVASASAPTSGPLASAPSLDAGELSPPEALRETEVEEPARPPPSPLASTCEGVSLVIASVTKDQNGLRAVVELRNRSAAHVPIMLPGDGSDSGRRNPTVAFELSPNRVEPRHGCGNMNALSAREIVFLAPRSRTELGWLSPPTPAKSGQYTLRATYRNDPSSDRLGDNMPGAKTDALVARVRKTVPCTLFSNTITFTWNEPPRGETRCSCEPNDPLCSCL